MRIAAIVSLLLLSTVGWMVPERVEARSLSARLDGLFGKGGIRLRPDDNPLFPPHEAHFSADSLETLGLLAQQLAPSAADFPALSTTPGFTFRYNSQIQAFERSSGTLGPVYVERPQTLGRGKLDFGVSYLSADFKELEGKSLDKQRFRLGHGNCCEGNQAFEEDTIDIAFKTFEVRSHVVSFFATYGLTDDWDVNILLPVVITAMKLEARATIDNSGSARQFPGSGGIHFFDNNRRITDDRSQDDDKVGVGDLQIRTKYHLFEAGGFNMGAGLSLRLPTGDEDNFQGLGDFTLSPLLALSYEIGPVDFHTNGGFQLNFDDSDRNRVRYAGGVTVRLLEEVALLVDVIGSSGLKSDRVSRTVTESITIGERGNFDEVLQDRIVSKSFRTDIVDLNVGFKATPFGVNRSVVAFATVFVPLNNDGLRADFIPAVGVEVGF
ncbi:MAG: transporter [Deltaproteobacteria bacterium]|nr:transporter [Deltaproteobacteria bacterium]